MRSPVALSFLLPCIPLFKKKAPPLSFLSWNFLFFQLPRFTSVASALFTSLFLVSVFFFYTFNLCFRRLAPAPSWVIGGVWCSCLSYIGRSPLPSAFFYYYPFRSPRFSHNNANRERSSRGPARPGVHKTNKRRGACASRRTEIARLCSTNNDGP